MQADIILSPYELYHYILRELSINSHIKNN